MELTEHLREGDDYDLNTTYGISKELKKKKKRKYKAINVGAGMGLVLGELRK